MSSLRALDALTTTDTLRARTCASAVRAAVPAEFRRQWSDSERRSSRK